MYRTCRSLRFAATLITIALAAPATAVATDYCVGDPACVSGGGVSSGTGGAGLKAALDAAAAHTNAGGPDRVLVGPGTYSRASGALPAFPAAAGDALILQGAGPSATIITRDVVNSSTVVAAGAGTTVRDLNITIPGGTGMDGLGLSGTAENVTVGVAAAGATSATGVAIANGASFSHGALTAPGGTGASMAAGSVLLDSRVSGLFAIQASGGTVTVRGARIAGSSYGIIAYYAALRIEDTVVDLGGQSATGIASVSNINGNATAALRHVTFVHGAAGAVALSIMANNSTTSTATLRDSIISGVGHAIGLAASQAGSIASLSTNYSSYPSAGNLLSASNGAAMPTPPAASNPLSTAPGFVDAAGGDWRLRHDSPLVDAGTPGALTPGEAVTDADGRPRLVAGRRDAGAFEYQRRAPTVTATASATGAAIGVPVTFSGSASDPDPGDGISYQWTFDDGATVPAGADATHAFAAAGAHTATLTAVDPTGLAAAATVSVTVATGDPAPAGKPPTGPTGGPGAPTVPTLSALAISPRAFRPGAGAGRGTRLTYTVSAATVVTFRVERAVAGRQRGSTCSARGSGKRCTRYATVAGKVTQAGVKGTNALRFSGRLGGRALKPGRYRLVARIGNGPAVRAPFTVAGAKG